MNSNNNTPPETERPFRGLDLAESYEDSKRRAREIQLKGAPKDYFAPQRNWHFSSRESYSRERE